MEQASTPREFKAAPAGKWCLAGRSAIVWCATPELNGCVTWGRPNADDVRAILDVFECYETPEVAPLFDTILDARRLSATDPAALAALVGWLARHREALTKRIRLQVGVIPSGIIGITMTGILPVLGETHRFVVTQDAAEGFDRVAGAEGRALYERIEAIVERASKTPAWLVALEGFVRTRPTDVDLDAAARAVGLSTRTLQRSLKDAGTTFQSEVSRIRFEMASDALTQSDAKIAAVARDLGLSERSLEQLVQRFAGCTPAELRRRNEKPSP